MTICDSMINRKETLPEIVIAIADKTPDKTAVINGDTVTSYSELVDMMYVCCRYLCDKGLRAGDAVAINSVMKVEYVAAFLAAKKLRLVAVPISKASSAAEASEIINIVGASVFLTDNPKFKDIKQSTSLNASCHTVLGAELPSEDDLLPGEEITEILFTSGSTGKPKGVMLSQAGIVASIRNTADGMEMNKDDVLLLPLPLNHSFGLRVLRSALSVGETIVLQNGFSFAKETQSNIAKHGCNCMAAVNAGFEMLLQQMGEKTDCFDDLRYIEFSAGAVPVPTREKLVSRFPKVRFFNTWGSTETGGALFLEFSKQKDKITSAGCGINDIETEVVGEDGKPLSSGEWGRLALKSLSTMTGYYEAPDLTSAALHDGWIWTNDLAMKDSDGFVYLNGRVDDIINVGGEKVAPGDVEKMILGCEGVRECTCIGADDPKGILGQVVIAFVVPEGRGIDRQEIESVIRKNGSSYMVPYEYVTVDKMPRNEMGKIDKKALSAMRTEIVSKPENGENTADLSDSVLDIIRTRRSIRTFTDKPVSKDILDKILLAGRMAPSGHNMQTWRFTVLMNKQDISGLKELTRTVSEELKTSFYGFNNPDKMIIVSNDRRNVCAVQDSSCAIENMLLMAHALGLGACWLNSWIAISDDERIRERLNAYGIPATHIVYGIVALGYTDQTPSEPTKKTDVIKFID